MGFFNNFSFPSISFPSWLSGKKNVNEQVQAPAAPAAPAPAAAAALAIGQKDPTLVTVHGGGGSRRRRRGSRVSRRKAKKGGSMGAMGFGQAGGSKRRRCSKKNHTHCHHK